MTDIVEYIEATAEKRNLYQLEILYCSDDLYKAYHRGSGTEIEIMGDAGMHSQSNFYAFIRSKGELMHRCCGQFPSFVEAHDALLSHLPQPDTNITPLPFDEVTNE